MPRLPWDKPARGWESLPPNGFEGEHWAHAPREAKAAFKAILGASDPGEREIGWGVAIPSSDGAALARAWALFPRSVSVRGARVEIHLNAAAFPSSPEELKERFLNIFERCHGDQDERDQDNAALCHYRLMSAARALIASELIQTSNAMLKMIAQAGGMTLSGAGASPEAVSRVESLLLRRQFELEAPMGRLGAPAGQGAPRRARL